jgi:hypothetical protein
MLKQQLAALQREIEELANEPDDALEHYTLPRPPPPKGLYWRLRWLAARTLRLLERLRLKPYHPWPPALRHAPGRIGAKPLLIWALGADRETLRKACTAFAKHPIAGYAPVLVTDVADFAFYSRLGWLIEFVPEISGVGESYARRKTRFLARLYRGAAVLPLAAGLDIETHQDEIRSWVLRRA